MRRSPADVAATFAALADPTRLAVVELLRQRPHRAGEIAQALSISGPALSRHLRVLRDNALVADDEPADDARVRVYRLEPGAFASLQDWVTSIGSLWQDQLAAFKAHAEGTRPPARSRGRRR